MNLQRVGMVVAAAALGAGAWRAGGWAGLALLGSGLVLWLLLYYTRVVTIMKRAANRPIGYVDSAVMLNARLQARMPLLHVVALTRSLGQRMSAPDADPEIYRWSDPGHAYVQAEFRAGRLLRWQMQRPSTTPAEA